MQNKQLNLFDLNKSDKLNNSTLFEVEATNGKMKRTEKIDISKNGIFKYCSSKEAIKKMYEAYWNLPHAAEKIKVLSVKAVSHG